MSDDNYRRHQHSSSYGDRGYSQPYYGRGRRPPPAAAAAYNDDVEGRRRPSSYSPSPPRPHDPFEERRRRSFEDDAPPPGPAAAPDERRGTKRQHLETLPVARGRITKSPRNKNYGFIATAEYPAGVFFHATTVACPTSADDLREGDEVTFRLGRSETDDRKPECYEVRHVQAAEPLPPCITGPADRGSLPLVSGRVVTPLCSKGYGFIQVNADIPDAFFHERDNPANAHDLREGDEVTFLLGSNNGKPIAYDVRRADTAMPLHRSTGATAETSLVSGRVKRPLENKPFGFIGSAENPDAPDVFFHESNVLRPANARDLRAGDDVTFRLGDNDGKPIALDIRRVKEVATTTHLDPPFRRFRGVVELLTSRIENRFGTIRVTEAVGTASHGIDGLGVGSIVKFKFDNETVDERSLKVLDVVEFSVETRNAWNYAYDVTLVNTDVDHRKEMDQRVLADATAEYGVISAVKLGYGFLKTYMRGEEVYFHFSNLQHQSDERELKVGREVKFVAVHDDSHFAPKKGGSPKKGMRSGLRSARNLQIIPRGNATLQNASVIAWGVTGIVVTSPRPSHPAGGAAPALESIGKVSLEDPVYDSDTSPNSDESRLVTEAFVDFNSIPNTGNKCWVQPGDRLLFNVVKDMTDRVYRLAPTSHLVPNPSPHHSEGGVGTSRGTSRVRLIGLALPTRAEGTVKTILKKSFGFINFAERKVDVHFNCNELLPDDVQEDVRRNMGIHGSENYMSLQLAAGAEVQFDMVLDPKESYDKLTARRIILLPPGTVQKMINVAKNVQGTISEVDPAEPYSGTVELDTPIPYPLELRHPIVARMIDAYLSRPGNAPLVFPGIQSSFEDETVIDMIDLKAPRRLSWDRLPPSTTRAGSSGCLSLVKIGNGSALNGKATERDCSVLGKKVHNGVKSLSYSWPSISSELRDSFPPVRGEKVEFSVVLKRCDGSFWLHDMRRGPHEAAINVVATGTGIVKDVVAKKDFGFISEVKDGKIEGEALVFRLSKVCFPKDAENPLLNNHKDCDLKKGDEVKFNIGEMKNGNRVALNVICHCKESLSSTMSNNIVPGASSNAEQTGQPKDTREAAAHEAVENGVEVLAPRSERTNETDDSERQGSAQAADQFPEAEPRALPLPDSSRRPDIRVLIGPTGRGAVYDEKLRNEDVVLVPGLFGKKQNVTYYYRLKEEVEASSLQEINGDSKISSPLNGGESGETVREIQGDICKYFNMDDSTVHTFVYCLKACSGGWPFHHSAA